ncbi:MAG: chromosome segregation protein ScpA [Rhizobiales bacterium NRL2]|jgi:segregation and condensation protein A|nr:MAG: chromosome segregation protein ScpA [Rhizobiales bacterium NRL2]
MNQSAADFEEDAPREPAGQRLVVDLGAYEGPLDLLLDLARDQKVDLARISMLALAEQYLDYVEKVRELRLELAADYLVMAAWLAYLKSRLLIPDPEPEDEPSAQEMAARLNWQLRRLQAMRQVAARLLERPREGQDFHRRGAPEGIRVQRSSAWTCDYYDLLKAYSVHLEARGDSEPLRIRRDKVISVEMALERMRKLLGALPEWSSLQAFLPPAIAHPFTRRSATASTLLAALELAKQGDIEIRQGRSFGPIYIRRRDKA